MLPPLARMVAAVMKARAPKTFEINVPVIISKANNLIKPQR
jgi:hypothetical protein